MINIYRYLKLYENNTRQGYHFKHCERNPNLRCTKSKLENFALVGMHLLSCAKPGRW